MYGRVQKAAGPLGLISPSPTDQKPLIRQSLSVPIRKTPSSQSWMIEWVLENIFGDLELIHDLGNGNTAGGYHERINNDVATGWTSNILAEVADALSKLKGDLPKGRVPRQVIQKYVRDEEHDSHSGLGHLLTWTLTMPHHLLPIST